MKLLKLTSTAQEIHTNGTIYQLQPGGLYAIIFPKGITEKHIKAASDTLEHAEPLLDPLVHLMFFMDAEGVDMQKWSEEKIERQITMLQGILDSKRVSE